MIRGIRGATTADHNTKEAIVEATQELLRELIEANEIDADDVAAAQRVYGDFICRALADGA